jgi:tape measure domain-containing protein
VADGDVSLRFRLFGSDETASRAFDKVGQSSERLHSRVGAVGLAIGGLAAGGVLAMGALGVGAIKMGLETASSLQQAEIGFTTMTGSAVKAKAFVAQLASFAASTPFEMPGLVDAARTLMGVGVSAKQVIPTLTAYGDAAGALGIQQDAFQRIMIAVSQSLSAGKIKLGDMNQLANNGLPVWKLMSEAMHKPVPELQSMISHGQLLSADVLPKLQAQMEKDYGGSMAKQSQTLGGLWSTMVDTFRLGMANVLTPLVPLLQKVMPGAMTFLGNALAGISGAIQSFINWCQQAGPAQHGVANAAGILSGVVGTLFGWFRDSLIPALRQAAAQIMPALQNAVATVSAAFRDHQGMVNIVVAVFKILASFVTTILIPALTQIVSAILATLGPAFRLIGMLVDTVVVPAFKFLVTAFMNVAGAIVDGAAWAFGWIPGLGPKLKSAQTAFHKFRDDVNAALAGINDKDVKVTVHTIHVGGEAVQISDQTGTTFQAGSKHRASGGPVSAGQAYVVGEYGQETFVPRTSGTITPHGGGGVTNVHLHMQSGFVGSSDQLATAMSDVISRAKARGLNLSFA